MRFYVGIDPGKKGAIALLDSKGEFVSVDDCPVDSGDLDYDGLNTLTHRLLVPWDADAGIEYVVALEKVHGRPNDGCVQAFNFGENFGAWRGALSAFGIVPILVPPQTWMKVMLGGSKFVGKGKSKEASLRMAAKMFPTAPLDLKGHDGRADAILIADWCRREHRIRMMLRGKRA